METNLLEKSRQFIKEGRYEKAQIILRRALEEDPDRARVLELCGDLAIKLGKPAEAIARYEHAAENYTHNGQYKEAILCLEKILDIEDLKETVVFRLVDLYRFYGLPNESIKKLLNLASKAMEKNEEGIFVAGLRKIVELQPKNLPLGLSFAKLLYAINRQREAEDELLRLKGIAQEIGDETVLSEIRKFLPNLDGGEELDPKSRIELGNLLYEIGSKDEAIVEFSRAASDLIKSNRVDEAISVLNRIIEIDPNNAEALKMLKDLKEPLKKEEEVIPETATPKVEQPAVTESVPEAPKREIPAEEMSVAEIQSDLDLLKDLSKEIEGFTPPEIPSTPKAEVSQPPLEKPPEPVSQPIEGQIADIEFLLKEAETIAAKPTFELAKEFDELRTNIVWESEDIKKKVELAKMAYEAELYDMALSLIIDNREERQFWPDSVEIISGSLIKLGRYSEAIKILGPVILLEEIPEDQKLGLRYLLASAYEGIGDFENALREIEHILAINPDYRDTREMYELLGGKMEFKKPTEPTVPVETEEKVIPQPAEEKDMPKVSVVEAVETSPIPEPLPQESVSPVVVEEGYPTIVEEPPIKEKPIIKEYPQKGEEFGTESENIAFI
ncbi:MAG: tetratricopeptide repeat protein [candidate division WOR-3 bacterium]